MPTARDSLLDTGPLVAVLDVRDQWHGACAAAWPALIAGCVTTEAVVVEACHIVLAGGGAAHLPLEFLVRAAIPILGIETGGHRYALQLMQRYADAPMDYADAALVTLADVLRIERVFTTDRRGFAVYRRSGGGSFTMIPERLSPT